LVWTCLIASRHQTHRYRTSITWMSPPLEEMLIQPISMPRHTQHPSETSLRLLWRGSDASTSKTHPTMTPTTRALLLSSELHTRSIQVLPHLCLRESTSEEGLCSDSTNYDVYDYHYVKSLPESHIATLSIPILLDAKCHNIIGVNSNTMQVYVQLRWYSVFLVHS